MTKQNWTLLVAFGCGMLFSVGLILSQMVNPAKVLNFLDIAGDWDPTLALVMLGAIAVTLPLFAWVLKRPHPLFSEKFYVPTRKDIDFPLVGGSIVFGIGWGIAGLCPGPAITAAATGMLPVLGFLIAMAAGALLQKWLFERMSRG
jgi:uncharacterized protein